MFFSVFFAKNIGSCSVNLKIQFSFYAFFCMHILVYVRKKLYLCTQIKNLHQTW